MPEAKQIEKRQVEMKICKQRLM